MKKGTKTKAMILQEAKRLFAQKGFHNVSMQDICHATGLSRGGLYRHYAGCHEIMKDLLLHLAKQDDDHIQACMDRGENAQVIANQLLNIYYEEMIHPKDALTLAIYEYNAIQPDPIMNVIYEHAKQRWLHLLTYGIERNEFHPVDQETFCDQLLFAYQGIRMWSCMMPIEQQAKRILDAFRKELFQ